MEKCCGGGYLLVCNCCGYHHSSGVDPTVASGWANDVSALLSTMRYGEGNKAIDKSSVLFGGEFKLLVTSLLVLPLFLFVLVDKT